MAPPRHRDSSAPGRPNPTGRLGGDRGAALIEAALVAPLFLLLVFGLAEFGFLARDRLAVSNVVVTTARAGSALGDGALADHALLRTAEKAAAGVPRSAIVQVVVFDAGSVNGSIDQPELRACKTVSQAAAAGQRACNRYTAADLDLAEARFGCKPAGDADGPSPDRFWCPTTRQVARNPNPPGPAFLGVYVELRHEYLTGFFGRAVTLHDEAVIRLEPRTFHAA